MSDTIFSARPTNRSLPTILTSTLQNDASLTALVRLAGRFCAIALCVLHGYVNRHLINPDGISYLDVADAYARGDWTNAINGYWSPLYSWMLAVVRTLEPSPFWESTVATLLNLLLFMTTLLSFELLLNELLHRRSLERLARAVPWSVRLPGWLIAGIAYFLFAYVSRRLICVTLLTPDFLVATCIFLSTAILLRWARRTTDTHDPALAIGLGITLGLGYLAKAVLFPLAFVFLGAIFLCGSSRRMYRRAILATLAFACLSLPWIAVLSYHRGHLTFGETGRLNYLWYVCAGDAPEALASLTPNSANHMPHRVSADSPVVDLAFPRRETYPLWYDPSRYYPRSLPPFDVLAQARASLGVFGYYIILFATTFFPCTLILAALTALAIYSTPGGIRSHPLTWIRLILGQQLLLIPAIAGLGIYMLAGHAEGRLIGPFVVLMTLGWLASLRFHHADREAVRRLGVVLLGGELVVVMGILLHDGRAALASESATDTPTHLHWHIAQELHRMGLPEGACVASVGYTYNAYWARLGKFQIVAEIPQGKARERFWNASPCQQTTSCTICQFLGARAMITDHLPANARGWIPIRGTSYAVRILDREMPSLAELSR